jgi:creatinine amidohydrolase/Fe(II)-dependent formamide hydrolase-like protein
MGDATAATAEDGAAWVALVADAFARDVERWANTPPA